MPDWLVAGLKYLAGKEVVKQILVSFFIGKVLEKLAPEQEIDLANFDRGLKLNNTSNVAPIPVIYGRARVGGSEFRAVHGNDNEKLLRCMVLSEGEIDSVENVYINDRLSTDTSTTPTLASKVTIEVKTGTQNQASSNMMMNFSQWNTNFRGKGVAYIVTRLVYDKDVFASGLPTITCDVKGKKVYDPRINSHSQTDQSTWAWSENPALCILDFLTNTVYGRSVPYSDIDLNSFIAGANYCDATTLTLVDSSGNTLSNQKRYTCNGVVNPDEEAIDTLRKMLLSCRGSIVVSDKYKLIIDKPETSVFTFDKSNIIGEWSINGSGVRDFKNCIKARFRNKNNRYEQDISITTGNTFKADDNNRQLEQEVLMPFTNDQQRVDILSQHLLKQTRLKWSVSFTATLEALALEAMDVVRIKHSTVGWSSGALANGKLFRITSIELTGEDTVRVTAIEYDDSVYTFDVNTPPTLPSTNLPNPNEAQPPSNLVLDSSNLLISKDGTIIERIKATWTAPSFGYVTRYEIAYKEQSDSGFSIISTDDTTFFISPVKSSIVGNTGIYFVKVRALYANGRRSVWYPSDGGEEHEVAGKSTPPSKPIDFYYAQLQDYTRSLEFTPPTDPDYAGVKIKFSTNLNATYDQMTALNEGIVTESPFTFSTLSANTYRFGIKSIDTSGNLSTDASFTTGVVTDNPNFEVLDAFYPRILGWLTAGSTSTAFVDTGGDLTSNAGSNAEWQDLGNTTWDNWNEWGFASETMVYETNGFEFGTALTFKPVIQSSEVGTATHQIRIVRESVSGTSGFQASDYTDENGNDAWFTPSGSVTAKAIRTKTTVTGVNCSLLTLGILLDGKQTEETLLSVDTSTLDSSYRIGTGHIKLPLQKTFNNITTIQVAFVNAGGNRSYEIIDKTTSVNNNLAPTIKLYNGSSLADATIDITTRGY